MTTKGLYIEKYSPAAHEEWNKTARRMRQSSFLMERDFMDYHADRYEDASLMVRQTDGRTVALLPACRSRSERHCIESHGGLTYGGLLLGTEVTAAATSEILQACRACYKEQGFSQMLYRPMPHIYHTLPAEEDLYALFRLGAQLEARAISSVVDLRHPQPLSTLRRRGMQKALKAGCRVSMNASDHLPVFWHILHDVLQNRHATTPVHTLSELQLLMSRFPRDIRLCTVQAPDNNDGSGGGTVAGCLLFLTPRVVHVQYIASSAQGRQIGALDLLFSRIIDEYATSSPGPSYLDFGISTEQGGTLLNEGLIFQKEGFGARAVCYDTYRLSF